MHNLHRGSVGELHIIANSSVNTSHISNWFAEIVKQYCPKSGHEDDKKPYCVLVTHENDSLVYHLDRKNFESVSQLTTVRLADSIMVFFFNNVDTDRLL